MKIRSSVKAMLQVGGGIRESADLEKVLSSGIDRVIIGTAAVEDPEFLTHACGKYPGRVLTGIDAREGMVAIRGWEEVTSITAKELSRRLEMVGVAGIIYTDIKRDGMLSGPNMEATREMVESSGIPVIASGGISRIEDIKSLLKIENLWGAITGKAIYAGTLDLKEAIRFASMR